MYCLHCTSLFCIKNVNFYNIALNKIAVWLRIKTFFATIKTLTLALVHQWQLLSDIIKTLTCDNDRNIQIGEEGGKGEKEEEKENKEKKMEKAYKKEEKEYKKEEEKENKEKKMEKEYKKEEKEYKKEEKI